MLRVNNLDCGYGAKPNVFGATFTLKPGEFLCLLGPNGSGKTAFLKTIAGLLPARGGEYEVDGFDMLRASPEKRASLVSYVPQTHAPVFPFSVRDVVVMGRAGRWSLWEGPSSADWAAADEAMATTGLSRFSGRAYSLLSGGERQMVMIARALAQGTQFILLDEPAASLDFSNQVMMLNLLQRLAQSGKGIIMASHNPEHALRYATHVAAVRNHRLHFLGSPLTAVTPEFLHELYNVRFLISSVYDGARRIPVCVPEF
jgi:iron complex transport system ATP-binding protein